MTDDPKPRAGKTIPFMVRLRPDVHSLVKRAAEDQRRSMASVIDQCCREQLGDRYADVHDRLNRLIQQAR